MLFLSTTIRNLEDFAAKEIEEFGGRIVGMREGKIIFRGDSSLIYILNYAAKTIFRVTHLLFYGPVNNLDEIRRAVRETDFHIKSTFAVRTKRSGRHEFTSMDVNAVVGEEILRKCPDARVNLDSPQVMFLCWLEDEEFFFTMDTTGESLHRRGYRVYQHPAPINPVLASLMLKFAVWNGEKLVDPFCGSGTILIEAHHNYNHVPNRFRDFSFYNLPYFDEYAWNDIRERIDSMERNVPLELIGVEKFRKHVEGCKLNARNAEAQISCIQGDAKKLHLYVNSVPHIITNPPFGLRIGSKKKIFKLYEEFAAELEEHFSGTIFTVIIPYTKFEAYFKVLDKRDIMYGDLHTKIYRFRI